MKRKASTASKKPKTPKLAKRARVPSKKAQRDAASASPPVRIEDLDERKAKKWLRSIHDLEREVENKGRLLELATLQRKHAKEAYDAAQEALAKEIQDQRGGPGPLFASVGASDATPTRLSKEAKDPLDPKVGAIEFGEPLRVPAEAAG